MEQITAVKTATTIIYIYTMYDLIRGFVVNFIVLDIK